MDRLPRKLAAIVYADVAGYSRLTGDDEDVTHRKLRDYLDLISALVETHHGTVMHYAGDAVLAKFGAVVDALSAAVLIQKELKMQNEALPDERKLQFRIGINLGDVIEDRGDIYGEGVNVAARLEGIADVGGICVSESVKTAIGNKLELAYASLGEQRVKNIAEPVRAYRVILDATETERSPGVPKTLPQLPDKPSIAVLPFTNMSGDPEQEYFSDGISEDVTTALSRMPWFFVIARNSSFRYKGESVNIKNVASELGVQYVLEGSVRKAGQRVRVTAQLIDALTDKHVWADKYDRELADVFAVQDEVVASIVGEVAPQFLSAEARRAQRADPDRLNAWDCVMRGRWHMWRLAREDLAQSRALFERAVELVPSGEFGASDLAITHLFEAYYNWTESRADSMRAMLECARRAVSADDRDPWAHTTLALSSLWMLKWDDALRAIEKAIELNPGFAPALGIKCAVLACIDEVEEAIGCYDQAVRLSPHDSLIPIWLVGRMWAYWSDERYEEALAAARQSVDLVPDNPTARRQLAACYAATGRLDEAREAMEAYLRIEPGHTADDIRGRLPSRNPAHVERFISALCAAGLPG